jgi:dCTP diphosphatase
MGVHTGVERSRTSGAEGCRVATISRRRGGTAIAELYRGTTGDFVAGATQGHIAETLRQACFDQPGHNLPLRTPLVAASRRPERADVTNDPITALQAALRNFAAAREWEQFHTPKNLTMALAGEIGELLEIFQWLTPEASAEVMDSARADDVRDELADVFIYLARLADVLEVDLAAVAAAKMDRNAGRFPEGVLRGRATPPRPEG